MLKKQMIMLLLSSALFVMLNGAEWLSFGNDIKANQEPELTISGSNSVHVEFYGVSEFQTTAPDGITYGRLEFPGKNGLTMAIGYPQVPIKTAYIEVGNDNPTIIVNTSNFIIYENYELYPSQEFPADYDDAPIPEFAKDADVYTEDKFFPEILAEIKQPLTMRGHKVSTLVFYPVQYNPVTKQLKVYNSMDVIVPEAMSVPSDKDSHAFSSLLKSQVINYEELTVLSPQTNMLIITPDEYYDELLPFKEWKEKMGVQTKIATESELDALGYDWEADKVPNATYDGINGYIKSEYDSPNPPDYLLLIGDTDMLPVHYITWDHNFHYQIGTDYYYSTMEINDSEPDVAWIYDFPDILIGRISIEDEGELTGVINKIIKYENEPYIDDTTWYNNVLMVAFFDAVEEWVHDPDKSYYGTGVASRFFTYTSELNISLIAQSHYNFDRIYLMSHLGHPMTTPPYQYYNGDPVDPALYFESTTDDLINSYNNGAFLVNYRGHGNSLNYITYSHEGWSGPSFTTTDIPDLNNDSKLPLMFSLTCLSGYFDGDDDYYFDRNSECLGEMLTRQPDGGVIGFIGSTRISYSGYNDVLSLGLNNSIFGTQTDKDFTLGSILNYGKMWMYNNFIIPEGSGWFIPTNYSFDTNCIEFEEFHLLGDPSMEIRTAAPEKLYIDIDYENNLVQVIDSYDSPVSNAKVVFKDDLTYQVYFSDLDGNATFDGDISPITEISASIHNSIPAYNHIIAEDNTWNNFDIRGDIVINNGVTLTLEANQKLPFRSNLIIKSGGNLLVSQNSIFEIDRETNIIIESGGSLLIEEKAKIECLSGSKITVQSGGRFITLIEPEYTEIQQDNYIEITGDWEGIICEPYSYIEIKRTKISGAVTAISGSPSLPPSVLGPSPCVIEQCEITNCENGINLVACASPQIKNNILSGVDTGTGIKIIQTDGEITGNTIDNFNRGLTIITGSPIVLNNTITNNKYTGVYVSGLNSYPLLVASPKVSTLNNTIFNNGKVLLDGGILPVSICPSQICVISGSNIYLDYGKNNIHSNYMDIPCVSTISLIPEEGPVLLHPIYARNNYWGSLNVTNDFFGVGGQYYIIYDPYSSSPFGAVPQTSPLPESDSKSYDLLVKALEAELDGKFDKAIKTYEKIIDKYPNSEEALVAYAKLPDNYNEEGLDLEPLISLYDENLAL
ncbi:MAG: hypothetical protein KAS62_05585, partial [Candidatus Delongbacteria bacterium]|nr:hypothetical protein [Candidatus Delongbacteria bacterium]